MAIKIEFIDSEYRFSHGHAPRGRGSWAFFFQGREFWSNGTFAEAKRACIAEVRRIHDEAGIGCAYIEVRVGS